MTWYRIIILNVVLEVVGAVYMEADSAEQAERHCKRMNCAGRELTIVQQVHHLMLPEPEYRNRRISREELSKIVNLDELWFRPEASQND